MPWQLIYTSAPRGLLSGQSGFCTVARSADLRPALVQRLEQISSYHYLRVAEAATANRNPAISAFRLLDLRGAKYYVLTRIQPCGLDFTARTNHLAHHLVFQPDELALLPSPAAILRHWHGWVASWQGEPRLLQDIDPAAFASAAKAFLPAQTWARLTGDGGRAAGLLESECVRGCYLICPPGSEEQVLEMYCETLQLLNFNGQFPLRPWRHTFTAFLQAEDNPDDFQWRACQENTPACKQARTRSAPLMALQSVRVPANSLVKLAREEAKPPPTPPAPASPDSAAAPSLRREPSVRRTSAPSPLAGNIQASKPVRPARPPLLDLNFSINSATLTRLGIFAGVLVVLLLIKLHWANRPLEQRNPAQAPGPNPPPVAAPTPKASPPVAAPPKVSAPVTGVPDAKQLDWLAGDGPTYILAVPNLGSFSLPIDSIIRFQRLLNGYDNYNPLPANIRLTLNTNRWDFPPGTPMIVGPQKNRRFSASGGGLECRFDYAAWWDARTNPLKVDANIGGGLCAFSVQFGFSSPTNGDPFRLLVVNENNPPPPLSLPKESLQNGRQDPPALLNGALRLLPDFYLLAGRRWQLQPLFSADPHSSRSLYLYNDWPTGSIPPPGHELDFAAVRQDLMAQHRELEQRLHSLIEPLGLALGRFLGATNSKLESFLAFSQKDPTRRMFQLYLNELKTSAPNDSWIKKWPSQFDPDQRDEASAKFQQLYNLWSRNQRQDQAVLTVTNSSGPTNFFFDAWQRLKDAESVRDQLALVRKCRNELAQAYVGLCIVGTADSRQPGPGLEMIRFGGP
jgi:hypothetical protein